MAAERNICDICTHGKKDPRAYPTGCCVARDWQHCGQWTTHGQVKETDKK